MMTYRSAVIFLVATLLLNWVLHLWLVVVPPATRPMQGDAVAPPPPSVAAQNADMLSPAPTLPEWQQELLAKLRRTVNIELQNAPLGEGLAQLREQCALDTKLAPNIGQALEQRVTLRLKDIDARTALNWLTHLAQLHYTFYEYELWVGPRKDLPSRGALETFETPWHLPALDVKDLIENKLLTHEFADKAETCVDESNGLLVVFNTPEVHEKVAHILRTLHEKWDDDAVRFTPADEPRHAELKKALKKKVSFKFDNTPLHTALETLCASAPFNFVFDSRTTTALLRAPVALAAQNVPLAQALDMLTKHTSTEWMVKDHAVYLGSNLDPELLIETRIYRTDRAIKSMTDELKRDPRHVRGPDGPFGPIQAATTETIADMLKTRIHPELWDQALNTSIEEKFGRLLIRQRPEVFEKIEQLLKDLASGAYIRRLPGRAPTPVEGEKRDF